MENVAIIISRPEEQWDKVYELLILGGVEGFAFEKVKIDAKKAPYLIGVESSQIFNNPHLSRSYSDAILYAGELKNRRLVKKIISAEEFLENPEIIKGWKRLITIDPQDSSTWPKYSLVWCWNSAKTMRTLRVFYKNRRTFADDGSRLSSTTYKNYELYPGPVEQWMEKAIKICKEARCEK